MHDSVRDFVRRVLTAEVVAEKTVLEVGSAVVNGSIKPVVMAQGPARYVGVDTEPSATVDIVGDAEKLTEAVPAGEWDIVLSTEMLEHVHDWRAAVWGMAQALRPGGLLVLTTRSAGFPYHPYPEDYWRFSLSDMAAILRAVDLEPIIVENDPEAYGVFVEARKPVSDWHPKPEALDPLSVIGVGPRAKSGYKSPSVGPQKLVVALPLYRSLPVAWFFNWLEVDKSPLIGHVCTDGMYLPQAMETLIGMAFDKCPDFDRLVVLEHDMIIPTNAFTRIASYGPEYDIVGSIYHKHEHPYHVMAWMSVDKPRFSPLTRSMVQTMVDNPGLYQVDGVAMGLTSIARHVLEDWNPAVPMWQPVPPFIGHDLHFCHEAKKPQHGPNRDMAYKVWLDSGIGCGHLTQIPIGYPHFLDALAENEPETWEMALQRGDMPIAETAI